MTERDAPLRGPAAGGVTLRDVAERAGVSRSAVSRTFTPGASVSARTRAKVEKAVAELGYRPNILASALTTGRTRLIGIIVGDVLHPAFPPIFDALTRAIEARGYRVLTANSSGEVGAAQAADILRDYLVEGVVVVGPDLPPATIEALGRAQTPAVRCLGPSDGGGLLPVTGVDWRACGRLAGRTLVARGYRRLVVLCGGQGATGVAELLAGFRDGVAMVGRAEVMVQALERPTILEGRGAMRQLLNDGVQVDACFCTDGDLAVGAMWAAMGAGLDVPGQIGLLALGGTGIADTKSIGLSTISLPLGEIAQACVDSLQARIDAPGVFAPSRLFAGHLVDANTLPTR